MIENDYSWVVKLYNEKDMLIKNFPYEHLGMGDRLILNSIIKKQTGIFREHTNEIESNHAQEIAIINQMRNFGFETTKLGGRLK